MKNKKSKLLIALTFSMLMISGLTFDVSAIDGGGAASHPVQGIFKQVRDNPTTFIKSEKVALPAEFDYIEELNREFVYGYGSDEKMSSLSGDSLKELEQRAS